ncbi:EscI/YscI/HrpB family type III secretion system inner rod protein [Pseudomonas sp. GXZC]|uniref:EscI/YscI/HrpB family type III secretion system inner rod protein n=1 Tax=Pseudomonas sp. GXZC TaxID=3003351 RepID=UPI001056B372|nr:EscI/YscI/HrpB family type III secretion system inner rod protein [Pseudomonas sp. GXZC]WAT29578.1 type III secretion apparatus protein RspB [Pseudomonas sp. GXZC]
MLVEDNSSIALSSHKSTLRSSDGPPSSTDVDFFTSELERPVSTKPMAAQFETMSLLANAATAIDTTKNKITRDLSKLSKNIDREALRKYPNDLSNALLMSHLIVKTLGKTTQCIDKICNLQ